MTIRTEGTADKPGTTPAGASGPVTTGDQGVAPVAHTPGPWVAPPPIFGRQSVRQDPPNWNGRGFQLICTLPSSPKGTRYGEMFKANARLIAAAPDLLEALKDLHTEFNRLDGADYFGQQARAARAAISKAEGH